MIPMGVATADRRPRSHLVPSPLWLHLQTAPPSLSLWSARLWSCPSENLSIFVIFSRLSSVHTSQQVSPSPSLSDPGSVYVPMWYLMIFSAGSTAQQLGCFIFCPHSLCTNTSELHCSLFVSVYFCEAEISQQYFRARTESVSKQTPQVCWSSGLSFLFLAFLPPVKRFSEFWRETNMWKVLVFFLWLPVSSGRSVPWDLIKSLGVSNLSLPKHLCFYSFIFPKDTFTAPLLFLRNIENKFLCFTNTSFQTLDIFPLTVLYFCLTATTSHLIYDLSHSRYYHFS